MTGQTRRIRKNNNSNRIWPRTLKRLCLLLLLVYLVSVIFMFRRQSSTDSSLVTDDKQSLLLQFLGDFVASEIQQLQKGSTHSRLPPRRPYWLVDPTLPNARIPNPSIQLYPLKKGPASKHNKTVTGHDLPGPQWGNRLHFLGMRLTTNYSHAEDVYLTLFSLPGNWFTEHKNANADEPRCLNDIYNGTLMHHDDVKKRVKVFVQLECKSSTTTKSAMLCGPAMPMELIPLRSGDPNQRKATFIWTAKVTDYLSKVNLQEWSSTIRNTHTDMAVRAHVWASLVGNTTVSRMFPQNNTTGLEWITAIDIPISTGVAGHAGPQIRSANFASPYFLQAPINVSLCVACYGLPIQTYLPEFVQHHLNVGFGQIVVGIDAAMDSPEVQSAERLLSPYIEQGSVVLAVSGVPKLKCDINMQKMHFYHSCLYHNKGLAEYSATWDVDEYWVPPPVLQISGIHDHEHEHQGFVERERELNFTPKIEEDATMITQSEPSAFSLSVRQDPIWQASNYSHSISIGDVMAAIDKYHIQQGCAKHWCYHLFESYTVYTRYSVAEGKENQTCRLVHDFELRDKDLEDDTRFKGIAKTDHANMGGIHLPGSCRFPTSKFYYKFSPYEECLPHRFTADAYGFMHHFYSMMKNRDGYDEGFVPGDDWPIDEYVEQYGKTVVDQLNEVMSRQDGLPRRQWEVVRQEREGAGHSK